MERMHKHVLRTPCVAVEEMEYRAAKLWAQLESAGIDPAENLR